MDNLAQKQYEADIFSREFREKFYSKFGIIPSIVYNMASKAKQVESLDTLLQMTNNLLWKEVPGQFPEGIKERNGNRTLVTYRQLFCYMAREMGYSLQQVGNKIEKNHATVLYSVHVVNKFLSVQDKKWRLLIQGFKNRLAEKYCERLDATIIFSADQIIDSNLPKLMHSEWRDFRSLLITIMDQHADQFKTK